jgi:hypothetical protein
MVTRAQRIDILNRRLDLVRDYAVLHLEREDIHQQLASLRASWPGVRRLGEHAAEPRDAQQPLQQATLDLQLLSERLRIISLRAQGILLEQQMLMQALSEP